VKVCPGRIPQQAGRQMRALVLTGVLVFMCIGGHVPSAVGLDVGDVVPNFTLTDIEGNQVRLSDYTEAGKMVILEHLNVYCHTCREAVPVMNEIYTKYSGESIQMVGIALNNSATEVVTFKERFDARYFVLPDPTKSTLPLFTLENVPTLDVIDSSGTLRYRHVGKFASLEEFDQAMKPVLGEERIVGVDVGNEAPLFKLASSEGQVFALENLRGTHRVILAFFADLSEKAITQAKILNKIQRRYESEGVVVLAVTEGLSAEVLNEFRKTQEIQYPVLLDEDGAVAKAYRVQSFPRLWLINEAGRVRYASEAIALETFDGILTGKIVGVRFVLSEEEKNYWLRAAVAEATSFKPVPLGGEIVYEARQDANVLGLVRIAGKDVLCDVCKDVHFVYAVDMEGRISSLFMIQPVESCFGKQSVDRFKEQLLGRSLTDALVYEQTVYGLSGSTNSAITIIEGLNETYQLLEGYKNPNFMVAFRTERCFAHMRMLHEAVIKFNQDHPDAPMKSLDLEKLRDYLPDREVPTCPLDGTYLLTEFMGKEVILCSFHGVDVERYGITFE